MDWQGMELETAHELSDGCIDAASLQPPPAPSCW